MRILFYIAVFLLVSCETPIEINEEEMVQKSLNEKFEDFKKKQLEECRENAILDADLYVDDRIDEMMRFSILEDSVEMISKPTRPNRPKYLDIEDPGPIKPFEVEIQR